jgi:hypothetical protein
MPIELTTGELAAETAELRDAVRMLRSVLGSIVLDLYDDSEHRAEMLETVTLRRCAAPTPTTSTTSNVHSDNQTAPPV